MRGEWTYDQAARQLEQPPEDDVADPRMDIVRDRLQAGSCPACESPLSVDTDGLRYCDNPRCYGYFEGSAPDEVQLQQAADKIQPDIGP